MEVSERIRQNSIRQAEKKAYARYMLAVKLQAKRIYQKMMEDAYKEHKEKLEKAEKAESQN
jgi:hypothetical protein